MNPVLPSPTLETTLSRMPHGTPHGGVPAHPAALTQTSTTGVVGKSAAEASELHQSPRTSEEKSADKLRGIKSTFMMPAQYEFFGMLGGGGLGWVAKKFGWERAQAGIAMAAKAPVHALRRTTLAESLRIPANLFKEASNEAADVGGKAAGWTAGIDTRAEGLLESANAAEKKIAEKAAPHLNAIGDRLDKLEGTKFGQAVQDKLSGFMKGRHDAVLEKHVAALGKTHEALVTEGVGFRKSIGNFFTRAKPATMDTEGLHPVFKELHSELKLSKDLAGADKTKHLTKLMTDLEKQMHGDAFKGEIKTRAGNVMKHLQKAVSSAGAIETYEHAAGEIGKSASLRTMAGALAKAAGRVPVFNALLTVGITAGVGAVLVTAHGESKEAKAAFKKVNAELATAPNSSFLKSIKTAQKSGKGWGVVKTGMRTVGEVAEGSMWMMHNGGGAGMMGAMMLPQLCEMMVPGNTTLGALEALDKNDQGKLQLKPEDRTQLLTQLIGGMESVAKNGGVYNRLAKAMACEMQERGYKYHDVVQLLGNDAAFNTFAAEVSAKQQAEAAKRAAEVKAVEPAVEKTTAVASSATQAPMLAAAPTTRIGVGAMDAQHKGMVVDNRQLAMA